MIEPRRFTNPFPGLRPFETDEYRLFFGREGQSDALITRLQRARLLAVVGTSGSGKSSLVRAGLLPALRGGMMAGAGSGWRICIMRPGSDPFGNLSHALADRDVLPEAGGGLPPAETEALIEATLRRGSLGLVDAARQARLADNEKLLVVVDQFEELFRFREARATTSTGDDASAFVKLLLEAAQQHELSLYVVLTMRSDFLGDCAQFQGLPEAINDGQYLIPRMTRDERRMAIAGPVGVTRGKIAEPLVSRLLNDVGDNPDQLPILQHALMRTWDYWQDRRNGGPLGLEHYEAIGTMAAALSRHADEAFSELPNERSLLIAERLFKALTERGNDNREIRRPTSLREICAIAEASEEEVVAVINVFRREGRSFLMPPAGVRLSPETVIDISHESLIRNWQRLKDWVNEEAQSARIYRRLAEAAVLNREGKEGLLNDPALQIALDWREQHKANLAWAKRYQPEFETAIGFLDASRDARDARMAEQERQRQEEVERDRRELAMTRDFAEKQRRAAQRLRRFTLALVLISVLALGGLGIAVYAFGEAKKSEREAHEQQKIAEAARSKAEVLTTELQQSTKELKDNLLALTVAQAERQQQTEIAKERASEAEEARKKAEAEEARAEKNSAEAEKARREAEKNFEQSIAAVERSNLIRKGLEAFQRKNFSDAQRHFEDLAATLMPLQPGAGGRVDRQLSLTPERAAVEMGWAYSNKGAANWKAGELGAAARDYERALEKLEKYQTDRKDPILFDTYHGVAHVYHEIATQGAVTNDNAEKKKVDSKQFFEMAERYYQKALDFQKGQVSEDHKSIDREEVAEGHANLARLFRDVGRFKEAEENFAEAVKIRLKQGFDESAAAALKEQGEFYRAQNDWGAAERVYNDLINFEEKDHDHEGGNDLADSYDDLGQIYVAKGDTKKAEEVFRVANLLQRTALKRRRKENSNPTDSAALIKGLDADFDELGNAYVPLGNFDNAEAAYLMALEVRNRDGNVLEKRKSWDKLTRFYREYKKDYARAEEYNKLLLDSYKVEPRSPLYAEALELLAALYSKNPNKSAEVAQLYESALAIYAQQGDWSNENRVIYALALFYKEQKLVPEGEQAHRRRLVTLNKYFNRLADPAATPKPKSPVNLVSEYLNAIDIVATLSTSQKNSAGAEAAYRLSVDAFDYITRNIYYLKALNYYVAILDKYISLLNSLEKKGEGVKVAEKARSVRDKVSQLDRIREQQNVQQTQQGQSQSTAPQ